VWLRNIDRLIFVWMYRLFPSILEAITVVKPETVIRWHRRGFGVYWRWKSRHRGGRRRIDRDYKVFYNQYRCHTGLTGATPAHRSGAPALPHARFDSYRWRQHCNGLFQTPAAA